MPIFEYRCENCGSKFEKIVWSSSKEEITCPNCGSVNTKRQFSTFATGGGSNGCGTASRFT